MAPDQLVLLLGGAVATVCTAVTFWRMAAIAERRSARGTGRIVGIERDDAVGSETPRSTWHARVRFATGSREHEFVDTYGTSWSRPTVGATVAVRFDPRDPTNAAVDHGQRPGLMRGLALFVAMAGGALVVTTAIWLA